MPSGVESYEMLEHGQAQPFNDMLEMLDGQVLLATGTWHGWLTLSFQINSL